MGGLPVIVELTVGRVQFRYEGEEEFFKENYKEILQSVADMQVARHNVQAEDAEDTDSVDANDNGLPPDEGNFGGMSIDAVVRKIGTAKGAALLKAAATTLTVVEGVSRFSQDDLIEKAKQSSDWSDTSHGKNRTNYLRTLKSQDFLRSQGNELYMTSKAQDEMRGVLAG